MPRYTNTGIGYVSLGGKQLLPSESIQLLDFQEVLPTGVIQETLAITDKMYWPVLVSEPSGGGGVGDYVDYAIPATMPYSAMPVKGVKIIVVCVAGALSVKFHSRATGFSEPARDMVANDVWEIVTPRGMRMVELVNITATAISTQWRIYIEAM